jgi:D-serine dehydratase
MITAVPHLEMFPERNFTNGLIESDSVMLSKLKQLVELMRTNISSQEWVQVIQTLTRRPSQYHPPQVAQMHHQILT